MQPAAFVSSLYGRNARKTICRRKILNNGNVVIVICHKILFICTVGNSRLMTPRYSPLMTCHAPILLTHLVSRSDTPHSSRVTLRYSPLITCHAPILYLSRDQCRKSDHDQLSVTDDDLYPYTCNSIYIFCLLCFNKTKVLLTQGQVTLVYFGYPVQALWFYCSQNFKLFGFPIFLFLAYLMNVFPDTRRAH